MSVYFLKFVKEHAVLFLLAYFMLYGAFKIVIYEVFCQTFFLLTEMPLQCPRMIRT